MKKNKLSPMWITLIVIGVILLIFILWFVGSYNGLVRSDETVSEKWANVQSAYQRRADLIPNLIATVEGVVAFEQDTQTKIAELRTGAIAAKEQLQNAGTREEQIAATAEIDSIVSSFGGLNINVEAYPDLKSNENFLSLQDELAGTENRVKVERDKYNLAVKDYNVRVRRIPTNIIARMFGFELKEGFESAVGSDIAPVVDFS